MEITTNIGCVLNCRFCPQAKLIARYCDGSAGKRALMMSMEVFRTCVDKLPLEEEICFSGFAEPWLNPNCTEMLRYVGASGEQVVSSQSLVVSGDDTGGGDTQRTGMSIAPRGGRSRPVSVFTTLVGMKMADYEVLRTAKLRLLCLHLPDVKGNARFPMGDGEYRAILARALEDIAAGRLRVDFFSCHGAIHPEVREAALACGVPVHDEMHDRAGNLEGDGMRHVVHRNRGRIVCTRCRGEALDQNILLPDGTVLLCCMDYGMECVLGNLLTDDWQVVAEGAAKRSCRARLASETNGDILCRTCLAAKKRWQYWIYRLPGMRAIWEMITDRE